MDAIDAAGFPSLVHRVRWVPSGDLAGRHPPVTEETPGLLERKFLNQTTGSTLPLTFQPELEHNGDADDGAARGTPEDDLDRYSILRDLLIRNNVMGELADRKAAVLLAFVGVAGKVVFDPIALMGRSHYRELLDDPSASDIALAAVVIALGTGFGIPTVGAFEQAFRALRPTIVRDPEQSQMFFADVAATDRATWEHSLMRTTSAELNHDLAGQVHATARITAAKHRYVDRAITNIIRYSLPTGLALYVIASLY